MADTAMKSASLSIAKYMTPDKGTSHSNEVILQLQAMPVLRKQRY